MATGSNRTARPARTGVERLEGRRLLAAPVLDPSFGDVLRPHYPTGVAFQVNDRVLERGAPTAALIEPVAIRLARKRKPSASGYLIQEQSSVAEERRGIAINTYGKVIKDS